MKFNINFAQIIFNTTLFVSGISLVGVVYLFTSERSDNSALKREKGYTNVADLTKQIEYGVLRSYLESHASQISRLVEDYSTSLNHLKTWEAEIAGILNSPQLYDNLPAKNSDIYHTNAEEHHKKVPKVSTSDEEFRQRKNRIDEVCEAHESVIPGSVDALFMNDRAGILYCMVPKAGCTFWKRVFHVAKTCSLVSSADVFNVSRLEVHEKLNGGHGVPYDAKSHSVDKYPTRLLVTRDPYSRLLSAYLDKIYLPDFWPDVVQLMLKRSKFIQETHDKSRSTDFLRQEFNTMINITEFDYPALTDETRQDTQPREKCGKFITFEQFVRISKYYPDEPHWSPIHRMCQPCKMGVTHISKMETFTQDARAVLEKMDLEDVVDDMDEYKQVEIELSMIVDYNYNRIHQEKVRDFYDECITSRELAYRLWQNFIWRGYIDPDVDYVIPKVDNEAFVRKDLMAQLWRARESGRKSPEKMKQAKKEFRRKAFLTLSSDVFETINSKYELDFELFGYEDKKDELTKLYNPIHDTH